MKKPKCKAKTCDNKWLVCMLSLFWSGLRKNCWKSLTHVLCFMLQTNKAIIIRWLQPQPSQKVVTSIYVIGWKLLSFLPFPCAYKAKLTTWISDDMVMRFKLPGRARSPEIYQDRLHHHQEEDEMAKACMLTFLLSGWQENRQTIIKTLYHSSWPYGLSSLLADYIKGKHLNQRQKKKPQQQSLVRAIHATQSFGKWAYTKQKPKPVLGHNTGFNFLMSACRIKEQARKICTTLTNMVGGWNIFEKKMVVSY